MEKIQQMKEKLQQIMDDWFRRNVSADFMEIPRQIIFGNVIKTLDGTNHRKIKGRIVYSGIALLPEN